MKKYDAVMRLKVEWLNNYGSQIQVDEMKFTLIILILNDSRRIVYYLLNLYLFAQNFVNNKLRALGLSPKYM